MSTIVVIVATVWFVASALIAIGGMVYLARVNYFMALLGDDLSSDELKRVKRKLSWRTPPLPRFGTRADLTIERLEKSYRMATLFWRALAILFVAVFVSAAILVAVQLR